MKPAGGAGSTTNKSTEINKGKAGDMNQSGVVTKKEPSIIKDTSNDVKPKGPSTSINKLPIESKPDIKPESKPDTKKNNYVQPSQPTPIE